jgi:predicted nucleotidyltransferase
MTTTTQTRFKKHSRRRATTITYLRRQVIPILKQHDVKRAALFGSFARGEDTRRSDLDLVIEFRGAKSLLDLVALKQALEARTRRRVDVLTYGALHPSIRKRILNEQVRIL